MQQRLFIIMIIFSITLIAYKKISNVIIVGLVSAIILSLFNLVVCRLISIFKLDESYIEKSEEYKDRLEKLYIKRNTYVNLYNYTMYGEKSLFNNIKSKISNEKYYDYSLNVNLFSNNKRSYEYVMLNEIALREDRLLSKVNNMERLS
mgnify:CR=1 FL=1